MENKCFTFEKFKVNEEEEGIDEGDSLGKDEGE